MNKLHMLALVGLIISGVNNASMMGQEQREVLYTLNTLGQDFVNVPMITQNIDMFMGVLEMNIQVNEAQLKAANQKMKDALWKNAALLGAAVVSYMSFEKVYNALTNCLTYKTSSSFPVRDISKFASYTAAGGLLASRVLVALNIHDAWKNRSELMDAIALDKEILAKLEEIKDSMSFLEENADSEGNTLLNSAE